MREKLPELKALIGRFGLFIIPGILVVIIIVIGTGYFQEKKSQSSLEKQVSQLNSELSNPVDITDELRAQYNQARQAVTAGISEEEVIAAVLNVAKEHGFDIDIESSVIHIESGKSESASEGVSEYLVLPFKVNISGTYDNISAFIGDLDTISAISTLVLDNLNINISDTGEANAAFSFDVYTLKK